MENNQEEASHKTAAAAFTPLFGGMKVLMSETPKAFPSPTSNNAIPLAHTLTAFLLAVVTGASRFAHTDWLRGDRALHAILGIKRFPGDDTVRAFFSEFHSAHIEAFWRPLWSWLLTLVVTPPEGFHLDLDSMILCREGNEEGARKGYNPKRSGQFEDRLREG